MTLRMSLHTGTISDKIQHHFPIVQIFQSNLKPIKIQLSVSNTMTTVTNVEMLEEDLSSCSIDDFGTFYQKFNTVSTHRKSNFGQELLHEGAHKTFIF